MYVNLKSTHYKMNEEILYVKNTKYVFCWAETRFLVIQLLSCQVVDAFDGLDYFCNGGKSL